MPGVPRRFVDNPEHRRRAQTVFVDRDTNDVILRLHETDIVRVKPNGDVILSTGGWATHKTMNGMNDALELFDMWVECPDDNPPRGHWQVYDIDGSTIPYINNKVNYIFTVKANGADAHNRCKWLADAFGVPYTPSPPPAAAAQARVVSAPPRPQQPAAAGLPRTAPAAAAQRAVTTGPGTAASSSRATVAPPASAVPRPTSLAPPPRQQAGSWANIAAKGVATSARAPAGPQAGRMTGPGLAASSQNGTPATAPSAATPVATAPGNTSLRALNVARQKMAHKPVEQQLAEQLSNLGLNEDDLDDDNNMCVVCMEALRTIVLVPCGHLALCKSCCEAIIEKPAKKECPLCCQSVEYHVEVDG